MNAQTAARSRPPALQRCILKPQVAGLITHSSDGQALTAGSPRSLVAVDELPVGLTQPSRRTDKPGAVARIVVPVALAVPASSCIAVAQRHWRWRCLWRGGLPGRFLLPRTLPIGCPGAAGRRAYLRRRGFARRPTPCSCTRNLRRGARNGERNGKSDE